MGTSQVSVSRWLAGERRPPEGLPAALAQVTGAEDAARILALVHPREEPGR
jgi:hypothetical protein